MGCKTQAEWEKIGAIQCSVRVTSNVAYTHTTKVATMTIIILCNNVTCSLSCYNSRSCVIYLQAHHNCRHNRYKEEHAFLQAEINCCPAITTITSMCRTIASKLSKLIIIHIVNCSDACSLWVKKLESVLSTVANLFLNT